MKNDARWSLIAFAVLVLMCAAVPAGAFNVMTLSTEISVAPGGSYSGTIQVSGGAKEESGHVYVSDWKRLPDGTREDNEAGKLPRSCGKWLDVSHKQFEISANENLEIRYSFTVPTDARGSYWTYVMVESRARLMSQQPGVENGLKVNATARFAFRLVINVSEGRNVLGRISRVEVVSVPGGLPNKGAALQAGVLFENAGNTFINARCNLEIRGIDGEVVHRYAVQRFFAFPESEWWVRVPMEQYIPPGEYLALAVVDYDDAAHIAGETRFTVPAPSSPDVQGGDL